jgi:hypothetical protein
MWSHGYNYGDRDRDRQYIIANSLKDSDPEAYNAMRRWGVRYVLGESMRHHERPKLREFQDARFRKSQAPNDPSIVVPDFDEDVYLDGNLKLLKKVGRFELFEVQGYNFPPS